MKQTRTLLKRLQQRFSPKPPVKVTEDAEIKALVAKNVQEILDAKISKEEYDFEKMRLNAMFDLFRSKGYTVRIIPGTPEENAPVFPFEDQKVA